MPARILLFCLSLLALSVQAQEAMNLQILSNYTGTPATYCFQPMKVVPGFKLLGNAVPPALKVSFNNYKKAQDTLYYQGSNTAIKTSWNTTGSLVLSGATTIDEYEQAIRDVWYKNVSANPTSETKVITITLNDADYLKKTEHFYKYISKPGITWSDARDAAASQKLYGLQGYLATITSKEENDFIWTKTKGVGWIGASDAEEEGKWKWVTGPEKGTYFWNGNGSGSPVNAAYSNWNTGEPNNSGGEHYAHITFNVGIASSWNDLSNTGNTDPQNTYYPQGYLIEFGGMESGANLKLSDYVEIKVINFKFADTKEHTICQFDSIQINQSEKEATYLWEPASGLSSPTNSAPKASPMQTTVYKVTATLGNCIQTDNFTINVNPAPIVSISGPANICEGETASLKAIPDNSAAIYDYSWSNNEKSQQIQVNQQEKYVVTAKNEFCSYRDSIQLNVHSFPAYSTKNADTLVCGTTTGILRIEGDDIFVKWKALDPRMTISDVNAKITSMSVPVYGSYNVALEVKNSNNCFIHDTLKIGFFQQPTSNFDIDSTLCHGYNLKVNYSGNATANALYTWMYIDTLSAIGLQQIDISLGFDDRPNRFLKLEVEENGCSAYGEKHIKVKPNIRIWADTTASCQPFLVQFHSEETEPIHFYEWDFGNGFRTNAKNPVNIYTNAGTYDVQLKVISDEGCENIAIKKSMITTHPIPNNKLNIDPSYCYGDTITINYTGDAGNSATYFWDLSKFAPEEIIQDAQTDVGSVVVFLKNSPSRKVGIQVMSQYNCLNSKSEVSFKRKPRAVIEADLLESCPPLEINFKAQSRDTVDRQEYKWNFYEQNWAYSGSTSSYTYIEPDTHPQIRTAINSTITGCSDTVLFEKPIFVYPVPTAVFQPDIYETSILNPEFNFQNQSTGAQIYNWDFGDEKGTSTEESPVYSYSDLGNFEVQLAVENEWACKDTTAQQIVVKFEKIFAPNAFSPNSPNVEDQQFLPYAKGVETKGYHLQIFNRWGQMIYETIDELNPWDGKMNNGNPAPAGTYIWIVNYSDIDGKRHQQTGQVSLLY